MISPTDLRAKGFVACGCGSQQKRTTAPWGCGRRGCETLERGGGDSAGSDFRKGTPSEASAAGRANTVRRAHHPAPSKPMPGRHKRGDAVCDALAESMRLAGIPSVEREFRFAPPRRWRFDIVARAHSLAVEVDGGAFTGGHSRGKAYEAECLKYAEALILGWRVLRVTPGMVRSGQALALVRRAIGGGQ